MKKLFFNNLDTKFIACQILKPIMPYLLIDILIHSYVTISIFFIVKKYFLLSSYYCYSNLKNNMYSQND